MRTNNPFPFLFMEWNQINNSLVLFISISVVTYWNGKVTKLTIILYHKILRVSKYFKLFQWRFNRTRHRKTPPKQRQGATENR